MQAQYLQEAIDTVRAQTYPYWECVIVNDASPDHTAVVAETAAASDVRIRVIHKSENQGLSAARNTGILAGTGDFIVPLDADDKLAPSFLEECIQVFDESPKIKVVYSNVQCFGIRNDYVERPDFNMTALMHQNIFQPVTMFKRADYLSTDGYRPIPYGYEDWDFWIQMLNENDEAFKISKPLVFLRVKEHSMVTEISQSFEKDQRARELIYQMNRRKYQQKVPELAIWFESKNNAKSLYLFLLKLKLRLSKYWKQ